MTSAARSPADATLAVVSHTPHHRHPDGSVGGWEATVREIDQLASLFDRVIHVAPLHPGPPPPTSARYRAENVDFRPVAPGGGDTILAKLATLARVAGWRHAAQTARRESDLIHIRCPAAISLVALSTRGGPSWVKYAGNWRPPARDSIAYGIQRRLLRAGLGATVVTVNGRAPHDGPHVVGFDNPSLTVEDLAEGRRAARSKQMENPLRVVFAGRLDPAKGPLVALDAVVELARRGHGVVLDVVGDGPTADQLDRRSPTVPDRLTVHRHGWLPRSDLLAHFGRAHVVLLPSVAAEGWPKVLSEGMSRGAVPVAHGLTAIATMIDRTGCGTALVDHTPPAYADAMEAYIGDPGRWEQERDAGVAAAERFGYGRYLARVEQLSEGLLRRGAGFVP